MQISIITFILNIFLVLVVLLILYFLISPKYLRVKYYTYEGRRIPLYEQKDGTFSRDYDNKKLYFLYQEDKDGIYCYSIHNWENVIKHN